MRFESKQIEDLFPELRKYKNVDYSKIGSSKLTLMIAMTARTGSSYLCSGLESVFSVGSPIELLNARDALVWEKTRRNVGTFSELIKQYIEESEQYIVFKTNWIDFAYFKRNIFLMFPNLKVVYLDRLDVEAQAVSLFKAIISETWHDSSRIKKGPVISVDELKSKFDLDRICRLIGELQREKNEWESFFLENEIQPVRIFYEDFMDDLRIVVEKIGLFSGFGNADITNIQSAYKKMADGVNEEWLLKVRNYRKSV